MQNSRTFGNYYHYLKSSIRHTFSQNKITTLMKSLLVLLAFLICFISNLHGVSVTFEVKMSYLMEMGAFNPATDFVDIAGDFNGWGSNLTPLADTDGDSIYQVAIDGFRVGQRIEFKFRINGQWDGTEEFPGVGNNRAYTVVDGENRVSVWYNDLIPDDPNAPLVADFWVSGTTLFSGGILAFEDISSGLVTSREWTFEGGKPETTSEELAAVLYENPGTYDVQLIVRGAEKADTLLMPNLIHVDQRDWDNVHHWNGRVFYEIFVRSFYDSDGDGIGDFKGLTEKLDYLNDGDPDTDTDLGITGIWLMPIHPTESYHGYDVMDYRAINPEYGNMEDFKAFLNAAHERGIAVIIDYVMNHSSHQHSWFVQSAAGDPHFRNFYRWSESKPNQQGPWGQNIWHSKNGDYYYGLFVREMPDLNYEYPPVRDSMFAIARYWLEDIGIDGFRLDAIKYLFEDGNQLENLPETYALLHDFHNHYKSVQPEAFTVGEVWDNTEAVIPYVVGDRMDFCFEFDLASALLSTSTGSPDFLYFQMQKTFDVYPHLQYGIFGSNHDQPRIMSVVGGNPEAAKQVASIYLTLPGIPFLYYGEEIGMIGSQNHPDIRTPMQWSAAANAGFTTGTPWAPPQSNYRNYNVADELADSTSILHRYRQLVQLRQRDPVLQHGDYEPAFLLADTDVYAFVRSEGSDYRLVVANLSSSAKSALYLAVLSEPFADGSYTLVDEISGRRATLEVEKGLMRLDGPTHGYDFAVYRIDALVSTQTAIVPEEVGLQLTIFPNPSRGDLQLRGYLPERGRVQVVLYDQFGREVQRLFDGNQPQGVFFFEDNLERLSNGIYHVGVISESDAVFSSWVLSN